MFKKIVGSFLALIVLGSTGCAVSKADAPENTLHQVKDEYDLPSLSWIITQNGQLTDEHYSNERFPGICSGSQSISGNFFSPVLLNELISDSLVNENDSLQKSFQAKDLIALRADLDRAGLSNGDSVTGMIREIARTAKVKKAYTGSGEIMKRLSEYDNRVRDIKKLLRDLAAISAVFDRENPAYAPAEDSLVVNLFPTWYTENISRFFGWKVFKFQRKTVLWNCFNAGDETLLTIKLMEKDLFIALCYRSANLPGPYDYNKSDLLQSPIVTAILLSQLLPARQVKPDYSASWDTIKQQIKLLDKTPYRLLCRKDLIAHARFFERSGDTSSAKRLYDGYNNIVQDSLLVKYVNKPVIAETGYIPDYLDEKVPFTIEKGGWYQVFAGGQVLAVSDYNYTPYQSDNIQLFLNRGTGSGHARNDETRVFHFNYLFNKIAGVRDERLPDSWLKNTQIRYGFSDPSDTSYVLEVGIPWREIGAGPVRKPLGMNIFIGDADLDENQRKSMLSWALRGNEAWDDANLFGILSFNPRSHPLNRKGCYSPMVAKPPKVDGSVDDIWSIVEWSAIDIPYQNKVSRFNNSGKFKSLYDSQYLYFLFMVNDNCKNKTGAITKDKCWIEDAGNGELIWKMPADTSQGYPSCTVRHRMYLKPGRYVLRYSSDGGHSVEGWYGKAPVNDIYGGVIYKAIKQDN
jgi:hypothetical protein